jgi:hypothetical protein
MLVLDEHSFEEPTIHCPPLLENRLRPISPVLKSLQKFKAFDAKWLRTYYFKIKLRQRQKNVECLLDSTLTRPIKSYNFNVIPNYVLSRVPIPLLFSSNYTYIHKMNIIGLCSNCLLIRKWAAQCKVARKSRHYYWKGRQVEFAELR